MGGWVSTFRMVAMPSSSGRCVLADEGSYFAPKTANLHQATRRHIPKDFYMHGSVHRESNLITVQQDATYSVYYISVDSSTCFGC